uniref:Purinergic receptor P2Y13 n=1 Tax=Lates calcarifer TaxID=8187 RepID=A0A4W6C383_LATCA
NSSNWTLNFMMVANNTSHLSSDCTPHHQVILNEAVSLLFFFLFPAALLLNGVAAWVSLHLHSNSTFIVMLPGAAVELKVFACRFSDVIFYCCLYTSIAFMGLISLDRFFKIVRPRGKMLGQNVVFSLALSALVWVMIFGCTAIPTIILTNQDPVNVTGDFCMSLKGSAGLTLHKFVVLYMEILFWLVSMLIVFCYIRITLKVLQSFRNSGSNNSHGKKKTKLRVFSILLVFFVCFVPLHIMRIPFTLHEIFNVDVCTQKWLLIVHSLALWVSTTNACLDPLLYIYLCRDNKLLVYATMSSSVANSEIKDQN